MRRVCQVRYADLRQGRALSEGRLYDRPDTSYFTGFCAPKLWLLILVSQSGLYDLVLGCIYEALSLVVDVNREPQQSRSQQKGIYLSNYQ